MLKPWYEHIKNKTYLAIKVNKSIVQDRQDHGKRFEWGQIPDLRIEPETNQQSTLWVSQVKSNKISYLNRSGKSAWSEFLINKNNNIQPHQIKIARAATGSSSKFCTTNERKLIGHLHSSKSDSESAPRKYLIIYGKTSTQNRHAIKDNND